MVAGSLSWQIAQIQVRKATVNKLKPKTVKSVKIPALVGCLRRARRLDCSLQYPLLSQTRRREKSLLAVVTLQTFT